jgi:ethanolamine ammonia-lyase small subunit
MTTKVIKKSQLKTEPKPAVKESIERSKKIERDASQKIIEETTEVDDDENSEEELPDEKPKLVRQKVIKEAPIDEGYPPLKPVKISKTGKREPTEAQLKSMAHARAIRDAKYAEQRAEKAKEKELLIKLTKRQMEDEIENNKVGRRLKLKVEKEILDKLKKKKLEELKAKYNYKSDDDVEDDPDNSDEEHPAGCKCSECKPSKPKYIRKTELERNPPVIKQNMTPLDLMRSFGF